MGEKNGKTDELIGSNNDAMALPVPVSAFQPGLTWKAMGSCWRFPDWHGALGRSKESGLLRFKKIDADQPEDILAYRTLAEMRNLLSSIINCASLYQPAIAASMGGYAKFNRGMQAVFGMNEKSLALHDRVSLIPSLASQVETNCIICATFHMFRHFIQTGILNDECGTPDEWNLLLMEQGNDALLSLLRRFEAIGADGGIGPVHAANLKRLPAFVTALMNIAASLGGGINGAASILTEPDKVSAPAVNVMLLNQTPVNVSTVQEAVAVGGTTTITTPDNQSTGGTSTVASDAGNSTYGATPPSDISETTTAANMDDSMDGIDGTSEPETAPKDSISPDETDDPDNRTENVTTTKGKRKVRTRSFYTSTAMQYFALLVLHELYKGDPDKTITAQQLQSAIKKKATGPDSIVALDEAYCRNAVSDLRSRFKREDISWGIPNADYRLKPLYYARISQVEKLLQMLENARLDEKNRRGK